MKVRTAAPAPKKVKPAPTRPIIGSGALDPFAEYYPAAKKKIATLPGGRETFETFDLEQVRSIRSLYFSLPPGTSFGALEKAAMKTPAFAERAAPRHENYVELFRGMREIFPWSWKGRMFVASSHALVDALLSTEAGTTFGQVIDGLNARHPGFSSGKALEAAARKLWSQDQASYPFAKLLPKKNAKSFDLRCLAEAKTLRYDVRGRLNLNEPLKDKVEAHFADPRFKYHFTLPEFCALVAEDVPGFNAGHYTKLSTDYGLPTYTEARKFALERLCQTIYDLYHDEKIIDAGPMLDTLHDRLGYPRYNVSGLSFFRGSFPDLVPDFRQNKIEQRIADGLRLAEEIKRSPDEAWAHVGDRLGFSRTELHMVFSALRRYHPEALDFGTSNRWTPKELSILQREIEHAPLGTTQEDLLGILRAKHPDLMLRHDLSGPLALSVTIRKHLDIPNYEEYRQRRFREAFVQVAKKSPDASITDLARHMAENHPSTYCVDWIVALSRKWRADPEAYPPIAELLVNGKFSWEQVRVQYTPELAKRLRAVIERHPGELLSDYVKLLRADPTFRETWPSFGADHIAGCRVRFPKIVPYVDELKVKGHAQWLADRHAEMSALADRAELAVDKLGGPDEITLAGLARSLGVDDQRLARVLLKFPERFAWYRPSQRQQTHDLYLATRVAHQMENAPPGQTLTELVADLRADPNFKRAYPGFSANSLQWLRASYPDLVPEWSTRNQVLRSKMLVDALLTSPRGTSYDKVIAKLRARHAGVFGVAFDRPDYVLQHWQANPDRFPFVRALGKGPITTLVGVGASHRVEKTEPNKELAARLARLSNIPDRLPLMEAVAEKLPDRCFEGYECIAIQHLLDSQVPTFDTYRKLGLSQKLTTVIGVPYSANPAVADHLSDDGWDVRVPPLDIELWKREIKTALLERIASAEASGKKILVLDDGGLVSELLEQDPELSRHAGLFKIVEQTTRGIRVAEGLDLRTPLVDVGTSWGKYVEGPLIGRDVSTKLIERLNGLGVELKGKKIGVTGYGTIGKPLIEAIKALEAQGVEVTLLDVDEGKMALAEAHGVKVCRDRRKFFGEQDIIVGTTGEQSITAEDLPYLKNGAILASASSKLVEIDVGALGQQYRTVDQSHPPTVEYTLEDGRKIRLLAKGFPINFDGGSENIPPEEIQLTRTLMLIGAAQAVGAKVAGFNMLDARRQLDALEIFEALGVVKKRKEVQKAVNLAKLRLTEALQHPGRVNRRIS